jgi:hypothetical protein
MTQPDWFVVKSQEDKVCKLLKSLYGLKQAPKRWHEKFDVTLISANFNVNEADRCVYYHHGGVKELYCAYMLMTYSSLGEADVILNIKLIKEENGVTLTQPHYVEKVLSHFGYKESKPSPTPYDPSLFL